MSIGAVKYQELVFTFLPADKAAFEKLLADLTKKGAPKSDRHLATMDDFAAFFDALVAVKTKAKIFNSALAVRLMAELAMERLEQMESADGRPEAKSD